MFGQKQPVQGDAHKGRHGGIQQDDIKLLCKFNFVCLLRGRKQNKFGKVYWERFTSYNWYLIFANYSEIAKRILPDIVQQSAFSNSSTVSKKFLEAQKSCELCLNTRGWTVGETYVRRELWKAWKLAFKKNYFSMEEEIQRKRAFFNNLDFIIRHNQRYRHHLETYAVRLNEFSDLTPHEFAEKYLCLRGMALMKLRRQAAISLPLNGTLPDSVNWHEEGAVTSVKNQGQCGACWSFSANGAIEGAVQIKTGALRSLSEQQLMDCSWDYGNQGCNGGLMPQAFQYAQKYGVEAEVDYKYTAKDGVCRYRADLVVANVTGYAELPHGDELSLQWAVATKGPISVGIDASDPGFMSYSHGVFVSKTCSPDALNHGVLVIGYGTEDQLPYWLVKNSWGRSWGEHGYVKMTRNRNNMCGIASMARWTVGENFVRRELWKAWKLTFKKNYFSMGEEIQHKRACFDHIDFIIRHNQRYCHNMETYTKYLCLRRMMQTKVSRHPAISVPLETDIHDSVNWNQKGAFTSVKNQGQRGACWSSSANGAIEGAIQFKTGALHSLSEQQLMDCSWDYGLLERPKDGVGRDRADLVVAKITGYSELPDGDEPSLQWAVATIGPISVGLDATDPGFMAYSHGVFGSKTFSSTERDHAVLAVG
ncbi:unnamed protein product [Schistocephalus solidus]|uniref:Cathepsin L-like proteinase n=1 Tax=Schistocephalus solidus TaxID=70667 RepID=A0A183SGP1_SCHSO|nr:unnamed protein product [Schistocephalus solidus]